LKLAFIPQENPDMLLGVVHTISAWLSEQIGLPVSGFVNRNICDGRYFRSAHIGLLSR
jgi:ABC-type phosphate/phosphonate transport system substrate-binding protein